MTAINVPFFEYPRLWSDNRKELLSIIDNISATGGFIMQQAVTNFETELAQYASVDYSVGVGNATDGMEIFLEAIGVNKGDEIIISSHTMLATASAIKVAGGIPIPVDIGSDNLINIESIENAITSNTVGIMPTQLNGRICDMDAILAIANKHSLFVVEDAAQGLMSTYKGEPLGSIGHIGCISFHATKNYQCGEGGAILLNDESFLQRAEFIREKGTNRVEFIEGKVELYRWIDIGSSYLPSELNAAFLFAQLESAKEVNDKRLSLWHEYNDRLSSFEKINVQIIPDNLEHNAHTFFIKLKDIDERQAMIEHLKANKIESAFHYIPLHESKKCSMYNYFYGEDKYTTIDSERLLRLPLHTNLDILDVKYVCNKVKEFFND